MFKEIVARKMDDLKADIKEIKDGTSGLNGHEIRIRTLENKITQIFTYGSAALIVLGIGEFVINKFLK